MKQDGSISVIIPVYNTEQYLRQCVDSVLAQTYQNFEIILVDDGSTDASGKICDEYMGMNPKIHSIHKKNGGASAARNVGLDVSTGKYVFFLDSDDWLEKDAFEKLVEPLQDIDIDFSFCEAYAIDEKSGAISKKNYTYHKNYGIDDGTNLFAEMQQQGEFHLAVWLILYRKSFIVQHKLRFVEKIMYEDCVFTYQVYRQAKKVAHIHEFLYHHRYRKNSVMSSKKTAHNFISAKRAYDEVVLNFNKFGENAADKPYVARIAYNAIETYKALDFTDKKKNASEFGTLKNNILENNAFSDKGLLMRCYGKLPWFVYKITQKLFRR